MTSSSGNPLRSAWIRLSWRVLVLEWLGTLLCLLLAFAWLQIPDSHLWQFVFSIVSGVLLVTAFVWMQTIAFRTLLRRSSDSAPFWLRFLICAVVVALWLIVLSWINIARGHAALYAGYWNSKFAAGQRYFFTYARLVRWQQGFWDLVQWTSAAFLVPIALEGGVAGVSSVAWHRIQNVYRHWLYWLIAIVSGFVASALSTALARWKPGTGVGQEVASTLIRVGIAYTAVMLVVSFVLALAAQYLAGVERDPDRVAKVSSKAS
ncbi:MAG TPA: hypothetical protein VGM27_27060 [Acidobacteriaceae bacterium]|jgi:hypothetical protein